MELVENEGVPTKVEETGKIFPVSNKAIDVLNAFLSRLHRSGAELALRIHCWMCNELKIPLAAVEDLFLKHRSDRWKAVGSSLRQVASPILAVEPQAMAMLGRPRLGHTIVPPRPALVPITTSAPLGAQTCRHHDSGHSDSAI